MSTMNKSLTVAELMATIGQVAEGASEKKELLDALHVISQAATDIVDLLEKRGAAPVVEARGAVTDVDSLAKAMAKGLAGLRLPAPVANFSQPAGPDWKQLDIEVVARDITGAASRYVITRK